MANETQTPKQTTKATKPTLSMPSDADTYQLLGRARKLLAKEKASSDTINRMTKAVTSAESYIGAVTALSEFVELT